MGPIHTALQFSQWAPEFTFAGRPPLGFAIAAISLVRAAWKQRPFKTRLWKPHPWWVLTLFFPAR